MTDSQVASSAEQVPETTWHAHVLDTITLHNELNRLWTQIGATSGRADAHQAPAPVTADGVPMRANTLNLIAIARTAAEADRIEGAVSRLRDFFPSRVIILMADRTREELADGGMDVSVALQQGAVRGGPAMRLERIRVETGIDAPRHLASVVSPLLVPELPDFLWWAGSAVPSREMIAEVDEVIDRLIVDSSILHRPGAGLQALVPLCSRGPSGPSLSDFAWARLTPWRQLVAQFFDIPAAQPCLTCLDHVTITFGAKNRGSSGLSAALLTAGWLATRLDWKAPGELIRDGDGWKLTLSAGSRGQRREILLRLQPTGAAAAHGCLGSISLVAHKERPGTFSVTRVGNDELTTASETATMPEVSRMVYSQPPDEAALLDQKLQSLGRDTVFEEALVFAADLLPDGADKA